MKESWVTGHLLFEKKSKKEGASQDSIESGPGSGKASGDQSLRSSFFKPEPHKEFTQDEIVDRFLKILPKLSYPNRKVILKQIIKACDPSDMK